LWPENEAYAVTLKRQLASTGAREAGGSSWRRVKSGLMMRIYVALPMT